MTKTDLKNLIKQVITENLNEWTDEELKGFKKLEDLSPEDLMGLYTFKSNTGENYQILFNTDGSIKSIKCDGKEHGPPYEFDLDAINNYWVKRGFGLISSIAATYTEEGPGDEDRLGLGHFNEIAQPDSQTLYIVKGTDQDGSEEWYAGGSTSQNRTAYGATVAFLDLDGANRAVRNLNSRGIRGEIYAAPISVFRKK